MSTDSDDARLIGLTVAQALRATGLTLRPHFVIQEPPGVARGVDGFLPNGDWLRLYIQRGALPDRLDDPRWDLHEFADIQVVGVARQSNERWSVVGQTMFIQTRD